MHMEAIKTTTIEVSGFLNINGQNITIERLSYGISLPLDKVLSDLDGELINIVVSTSKEIS